MHRMTLYTASLRFAHLDPLLRSSHDDTVSLLIDEG